MHRPYGEKKKKKQNVIFVWFFSSRLRIFFRCAAHHVHEYMETAIIKLYYDACEAYVTVITDASSTCESVFERENLHVTMRREIIEKKSFVLFHDQNTWKDNHVSEQQVKNMKKKNRLLFSSLWLYGEVSDREGKTSLY